LKNHKKIQMPNYCVQTFTAMGEPRDLAELKKWFRPPIPPTGRNAWDDRHFFPFDLTEIRGGTLTAEEVKEQLKLQDFGKARLTTADECLKTNFPDELRGRVIRPFMQSDATFLQYRFSTKWRPPPNETLIDLSKKLPYLLIHIMYAERGMYFVGEKWLRNGQLFNDYQRKVRKEEETCEESTFHGPFAQLLARSG
jgi:hypothetical protein